MLRRKGIRIVKPIAPNFKNHSTMSQEQEEKIFASGFSFSRNEKAPDWVVGRMSIKVDDAIAFLQEHKNEKGWVNVNVKKARKTGNHYVELDTYQPQQDRAAQATATSAEANNAGEEDDNSDLPF